ncbi:MAG: hypothetical protein WBN50_02945, partial [Lutimonas sp.]
NRPTGTLAGVDNRKIYTDADKNSFQNGAYVFTNSSKGNTFNWSAKVEKSWINDLYISLAYNYLKAQDVNSIEAEITGDAFAGNPALGNVNDDVLARSKYGDDHRFIGVVSKNGDMVMIVGQHQFRHFLSMHKETDFHIPMVEILTLMVLA